MLLLEHGASKWPRARKVDLVAGMCLFNGFLYVFDVFFPLWFYIVCSILSTLFLALMNLGFSLWYLRENQNRVVVLWLSQSLCSLMRFHLFWKVTSDHPPGVQNSVWWRLCCTVAGVYGLKTDQELLFGLIWKKLWRINAQINLCRGWCQFETISRNALPIWIHCFMFFVVPLFSWSLFQRTRTSW